MSYPLALATTATMTISYATLVISIASLTAGVRELQCALSSVAHAHSPCTRGNHLLGAGDYSSVCYHHSVTFTCAQVAALLFPLARANSTARYSVPPTQTGAAGPLPVARHASCTRNMCRLHLRAQTYTCMRTKKSPPEAAQSGITYKAQESCMHRTLLRDTQDLQRTPSPPPTLNARCPVVRISLPRVMARKGHTWWSYMAGDAHHKRENWRWGRFS